jgi:hypothetical protein
MSWHISGGLHWKIGENAAPSVGRRNALKHPKVPM